MSDKLLIGIKTKTTLKATAKVTLDFTSLLGSLQRDLLAKAGLMKFER